MVKFNKSNIFIYLFCVLISILSIYALNYNIKISLLPHITVMNWLYNFKFEFVPDVGYKQINGLFTISQSCLGSKLFISLFLILVFGFLREYGGLKKKFAVTLAFYFASIILAFLITIIRISISIPFCNFPDFKLIHTILSLIIYFGSGMTIYYLMGRITKRKGHMA